MQDIFGEYQRYFSFITKVAEHEFTKNGFNRISTPIVERVELIRRSLGEGTDVVSKEMYTFLDRKDRELVLKPESTAGIMRAYLEELLNEPQPVNLFYFEPHFRYERPQKGRYRQFHQLGAEVIGELDPVIDARLIFIGKNILDSIGLKGQYTIKINSIGVGKEREKFIEELTSFFANKKHLLDETDLRRLETNPLRILDTKNADTKELLKHAPKITDFLKGDSLAFYTKCKEYLNLMNVEFEEDPTLVRGLDYYCHTVWEFVDNSGRSQDALLGGGRYNELAKMIGNKTEVPSSGFASGIERLIDHMIEAGVTLKNVDALDVYFIQLGEEAKKVCLNLSLEARILGLKSLCSLGAVSVKTQLKKANKLEARFVVIVGIMEAKKGVCQLKDMAQGTQTELPIDKLFDLLLEKIGTKNLDFYNPGEEIRIAKQIPDA